MGIEKSRPFWGLPSGTHDKGDRQRKTEWQLYKLADGGWLCLVVKPIGSRLWWYRYRFDGREKTLRIGEYTHVGLKEAREDHFAARKLLAAGIDPMAERKAESEAKQS